MSRWADAFRARPQPVTQLTLPTHPNKGVSIVSPVSCCLTIMITQVLPQNS